MQKNICIFCDGTWNSPADEEYGTPTPTNVYRLFEASLDQAESSGKQMIWYQPGVGALGGPWRRMGRRDRYWNQRQHSPRLHGHRTILPTQGQAIPVWFFSRSFYREKRGRHDRMCGSDQGPYQTARRTGLCRISEIRPEHWRRAQIQRQTRRLLAGRERAFHRRLGYGRSARIPDVGLEL